MQRPQPDSLPETPGVYLYKDKEGVVIYVGKARNLRKRILSYFRENLSTKTIAMLSHADSITTITTETEKDALLLESTLIKKYLPHYNIALRDDKQYVLFRIDPKSPFPRLETVRQAKRRAQDNALYFGPFTDGVAARETWKIIHKIFPLRRCRDRLFKNRVRPCLYYHLGQCLAPCQGKVTQEEYQAVVRQVEMLLSGRSKELLETLRQEMQAASDSLEFELAAKLRDQIHAIEQTIEEQHVILPDGTIPEFYQLPESAQKEWIGEKLAAVFKSKHTIHRIECVDVSHISGDCARIGMVVFEDGQPLKTAYRTWSLPPEAIVAGDDYAALAFWAKHRVQSGPPWADLVLIDGGKGQIAAVSRGFQEAFQSEPIPFLLAGIAKARTENGRPDRRAGNVQDRIFLAHRKNPLPLRNGSEELLFLQYVRDNAHRYALSRHRQAKRKALLSTKKKKK